MKKPVLAAIVLLLAAPFSAGGATPVEIAAAALPVRVDVIATYGMAVSDALAWCAENGYPCAEACRRADPETAAVWCEAQGLCCARITPAAGGNQSTQPEEGTER